MNRIKLTLVDDSPVGTVDNFEIKDGAWPYGSAYLNDTWSYKPGNVLCLYQRP